MNKNKYSITFACYNALDYTKKCIESMVETGTPLERLIIVDNGSTDGTREYLSKLPIGHRIFNNQNLGCGVAWNQGALHFQSEWTIIMNNDVIVSPSWIEGLIHTAEKIGVKIISPALIEGSLDYNFQEFQYSATKKMFNTHRIGAKHAVCLAIHESVWLDIGYFSPTPKLLGYEDTLFFHEANKSNIKMAMTGASWLHHYGSITQSLMKQERGLSQKDGLSNRKNFLMLNQSWLTRKFTKHQKNAQNKKWRDAEISAYNMTIHGLREKGEFRWI